MVPTAGAVTGGVKSMGEVGAGRGPGLICNETSALEPKEPAAPDQSATTDMSPVT